MSHSYSGSFKPPADDEKIKRFKQFLEKEGLESQYGVLDPKKMNYTVSEYIGEGDESKWERLLGFHSNRELFTKHGLQLPMDAHTFTKKIEEQVSEYSEYRAKYSFTIDLHKLKLVDTAQLENKVEENLGEEKQLPEQEGEEKDIEPGRAPSPRPSNK